MPAIKSLEIDGIDRSHLPQIPKKALAEFVQWLRQNEVHVALSTVAAETIKPIQTAVNQDKVKAMRQNIEALQKTPLIVSQDMFLMDGHHRWAVLQEKDPEMKVWVLRVDVPMRELVSLAKEFEGSYSAGIGEVKLSSFIPKKILQYYRPQEWI